MLIEYVCVYNSCLSYIQEEHTAVMNPPQSCFLLLSHTVEHTKRVEKSSLDTLLIFSELKGLVHICMYHHEGLS